MNTLRGLQSIGLGLVLALLAPGCGPKPSTPPPAPPPPPPQQSTDPRSKIPQGVMPAVDRFDAGTDLQQLALFYKTATVERGPANVQEMGNLHLQAPKLYQALQDGRYVLYWGANPLAPANAVLGYEKNVPTQGGVVVLMDGSIQRMTAQEFLATPKAGQ